MNCGDLVKVTLVCGPKDGNTAEIHPHCDQICYDEPLPPDGRYIDIRIPYGPYEIYKQIHYRRTSDPLIFEHVGEE